MFPKSLFILALFALSVLSAPPAPEEPTAGRYIITLRDGVNRRDHINSLSRRGVNWNSWITHELAIINGFVGHFSASDIGSLRTHPDVLFVEKDSPVRPQVVQQSGLIQ